MQRRVDEIRRQFDREIAAAVDPQAVEALQQIVAGPAANLPSAAHAAALEALGLLLDRNAGWRLVHAATGRNFAIFPDWLARALATTTL